MWTDYEELWLVRGKLVFKGNPTTLWKEGWSTPYRRGEATCFYSRKTGEVWGQRIPREGATEWHYFACEPSDIRLLYELDEPAPSDSYFLHLVENFEEILNANR